jgi:hypothetical protein
MRTRSWVQHPELPGPRAAAVVCRFSGSIEGNIKGCACRRPRKPPLLQEPRSAARRGALQEASRRKVPCWADASHRQRGWRAASRDSIVRPSARAPRPGGDGCRTHPGPQGRAGWLLPAQQAYTVSFTARASRREGRPIGKRQRDRRAALGTPSQRTTGRQRCLRGRGTAATAGTASEGRLRRRNHMMQQQNPLPPASS